MADMVPGEMALGLNLLDNHHIWPGGTPGSALISGSKVVDRCSASQIHKYFGLFAPV
jgi:hypothetical protein